MKKIFLVIILLLLVVGLASVVERNERLSNQDYSSDPLATQQDFSSINGDLVFSVEESVISWRGTKPGGEHIGFLTLVQGELLSDLSGSLVIDMTSITSDSEVLDEHLKSNDFLKVEEYPEAQFVINTIENGVLFGQLTLLDVTQEIQVPVQLMEVNESLVIESSCDIDRTDFGIEYGSGSIFDNLGDAIIDDTVSITVSLVATEVE